MKTFISSESTKIDGKDSTRLVAIHMPTYQSLNLTPGESLYLKDPWLTYPGHLLKVTFADLLLKKAIKAEVGKSKFLFWTKEEIYVSHGESYSKLKFRPHENIILSHIASSPKKLRDLALDLRKTLKTPTSYSDNFLRDPLMHKGYLRVKEETSLWLFSRAKYELTVKGLDAHDRISYLLYLAKNLKIWAEEEPARAKAYLSVCGANILLLSPKDLEIVKSLSKELDNVQANTDSYYDYYWYDYTWRHHLNDDIEFEQDIDINFIDFSLPEFDILDSFDSIGSSFDSLEEMAETAEATVVVAGIRSV